MKTQELLDKYQKLLGGLLKCDPKEIIFECSAGRGTNKWTEIGSLDWKKEETGEEFFHDWRVGHYRVIRRNAHQFPLDKRIGSFELYQMPHCCGIMVSCRAEVAEEFRGRRIGTTLNTMRQDIGRILGFSYLMCTDIEKNTHQRQLLKTNQWKDLESFVNRRTGNRVYICGIHL
jgi:hypothetical protein